ncbi:MAG: hypothetical protein AB1742_09280, partial [bacterium]
VSGMDSQSSAAAPSRPQNGATLAQANRPHSWRDIACLMCGKTGLLVALGRIEARLDRLLSWNPWDDENYYTFWGGMHFSISLKRRAVDMGRCEK